MRRAITLSAPNWRMIGPTQHANFPITDEIQILQSVMKLESLLEVRIMPIEPQYLFCAAHRVTTN